MLDLAIIQQGEQRKANIYLVDVESKSVRHPESFAEVPWPVIWMLAGHSRKHIMQTKLPSLSETAAQVTSAANKLCWSHWHSGHIPEAKEWWWLRPRKKFTPECPHVAPPELKWLIGKLKAEVRNATASALQLYRGRTASTPLLARLAGKCLRLWDLMALPSDKDSGFCLVCKKDLPRLIDLSIKPGIYSSSEMGKVTSSAVHGGYSSVISGIFNSSKDENLRDVLRGTSGTMLCRAQFTVKSHKNPGSVVLRILHSSLGHKYIPLAKWIVHMVKPQLKALSHIYSDSTSMLRAMREVRITDRTLLVKADVRDFYLSGNPEFLAKSFSSFAAAADRDNVFRATLHILSHQYLHLGDSIVQCNTGAGMGFLFSGEVADAGFYREVEE